METIGRNLEDLSAFHVVAVEGSFTRAAEILGTSKSAVSKQVSRLETYLRAQLFHRTTRTLALTEQGSALLEYSTKIFELSREAGQRLKDMTQGASGTIRISSPVSAGEYILPALMPKLSAELPNVFFELDLTNENRDFKKDAIDFSLRAADVDDPDLIARYLGRIRDVICVKKNLVIDHPKKLKNAECILHSQETNWNAWTFTKGQNEIRVEVSGRHATNQYGAMLEMCREGLGVARLPYYIARRDLEEGRLVSLLDDYRISTHPLYLVYLRAEYTTLKHKKTKEVLLKWAESSKEIFF